VDINVTLDLIAGALFERRYRLGQPVTSAYLRKVIDQVIAGGSKSRHATGLTPRFVTTVSRSGRAWQASLTFLAA
jgi:hypothetical protein